MLLQKLAEAEHRATDRLKSQKKQTMECISGR